MSRNAPKFFPPADPDRLYEIGDKVIQREILEFDCCGKLCEEDMRYAMNALGQAAIWFVEEKRDDEADHARRLIGVAQKYLTDYKNVSEVFYTPKRPSS